MKVIVKHPHERIGHYAEIPNDLKAVDTAIREYYGLGGDIAQG